MVFDVSLYLADAKVEVLVSFCNKAGAKVEVLVGLCNKTGAKVEVLAISAPK